MSNKECYHFNCYPLVYLDSSNLHWCPDCIKEIDENEIIRVNKLLDKRNKLNRILTNIK